MAQSPVGPKLKKAREQRAMTVSELEELTEVPARTIQDIEYGRTKQPGFDNVCKIARALNLSLDALADLPARPEVMAFLRTTIEEQKISQPAKLLALFLQQFEASPAKLRALCLAFLFQNFELLRKYEAEIQNLMPRPKAR